MGYKFSVVIPIYNAEKYIEDAVQSVISQTVGFERNIQLILVNDGSTDGSGETCRRYRELYPGNVIYVEKQNDGVSDARNCGMCHADGKYINFLDADDMWLPDAFEKAWDFMELHDEIDVAACMLEYFDGRTGLDHPLNWKFDDAGIVNIFKSPSKIQMHVASCFIRSSGLGTETFKTGLRYGEDSLFINRLILRKKKYGIIPDIHYMYRKRKDKTSAIDRCNRDRGYYSDTLNMFLFRIMKDSMNEMGFICPYIQHVAMYDLQWRIKKTIPDGILSESEERLYRDNISSLLSNIDDSVIMVQQNIWSEHKMLALSMKYRRDISKELIQADDCLYYKSTAVYSVLNGSAVKITRMDIAGRKLHIEGLINIPLHPGDYSIHIENQYGEIQEFTSVGDFARKEKVCVYGHYYYDRHFTADIPLIDGDILKAAFYFSYKGFPKAAVGIGYGDTCWMNTALKHGYLKTRYNIIEKRKTWIIVRNNSRKLLIKKEARCIAELLKNREYSAAMYRAASWLVRAVDRKGTWIISDRDDAAGDNGEAFFKFMQGKKNPRIRACFAVSRKSEDYARMKKIGRCIDADSVWYKIRLMTASKVISSQANECTTNPFGEKKQYLKDLFRFDFVFLQHGILKDDLSSWLNCADKDIRMFVTSTEREYMSVINGNYGYGEDVVKLTGMPRYDLIPHTSELNGCIAVIPTWRKSITDYIGDDAEDYAERQFKDTKFFKFYNSLINNKQLLSEMRKAGYRGILCMHPMMKQFASFFEGNDVFDVSDGSIGYNSLIVGSDMLITDYSSLFFDFAYAGKPAVYAQFDQEEFFSTHSYSKGYFDYEKDGFGKVAYDMQDTVTVAVDVIRHGCARDEAYSERANEFFQPDIGNRSENVYREICSMDKHN